MAGKNSQRFKRFPAPSLDTVLKDLNDLQTEVDSYSSVLELAKTATQPADVQASIFAYNKRTIKLSQVNVYPSMKTSQHAGIIDAFNQLEKLGGGCIEIDNNDYYGIEETIAVPTFTKTIHIENPAGGILKGMPALDAPIMKLGNPAGTAPNQSQLITHDLFMENMNDVYVVGASSSEGLQLLFFDRVILNNFKCAGGFDPVTMLTTGGDSGVSSVGCRVLIINDPIISGQSDTAFYPNWNNGSVIDGYVEINRPILFNNMFCLTAKRRLAEVFVNGGEAYDNIGGFSVQNVGTTEDVCQRMELDGIKIYRTLANVAVWRDNAKGGIRNCHVKDIGYRPDGSNPAGGNAIAVDVRGASGIFSEHNLFEMSDWAPNAEYAYRQDNSAFASIAYTGGNLIRKGNKYRNWSRHTRVDNVGLRGHESDATFDGLGVASRYNAPNFDTQGDRIEYYDTTDSKKKFYFGGTEYVENTGRVGNALTIPLAAIGILGAGVTTSMLTVAAPKALPGDEVNFTRLTTLITSNPLILISGKANTNVLEYYVTNATAAPFNFAVESIQASINRL